MGDQDRAKLRHVDKAFNKCSHSAPSFTMRGKTAFGNEERYRNTGGECGKDLSAKLDNIRSAPPKWSMRGRSTGISKPTGFPGPGDYPVPSTLDRSHPCLPTCGKGFTITGRPTNNSVADVAVLYGKDTPSPQQYNTQRKDGFGTKAQRCVPSYTIGTKLKDPADREVRPGCQKYNPQKVGPHGPINTPAWTMRGRGKFTSKYDLRPGPGEHVPKMEASGRIAKQPCYSFGSNPRFSEAAKDDRMF